MTDTTQQLTPRRSEALDAPLVGDNEFDVQIATAKKWPRNVRKCLDEAEQLACMNEEVAGDCFYTLERKDRDGKVKLIQDASVRFAEILLHSWRNVRCDARIVDDTGTHIVAEGIFFDLERNVAVRKQAQRRITTRDGRRYGDDMIGVAGQAAISVALRNSVHAGIPRALWDDIWKKARVVSIGVSSEFALRRQRMVEHFVKIGVTQAQVFAKIGVKTPDEVTAEHIALLRGLATAIKDGEATIQDAFGPRAEEGPARVAPSGPEPVAGGGPAPTLDVEAVDYGAGETATPTGPTRWTNKRQRPAKAKPGDTWQKDGQGPTYVLQENDEWAVLPDVEEPAREDPTPAPAPASSPPSAEPSPPATQASGEDVDGEVSARIDVAENIVVYLGRPEPPSDAPADSFWYPSSDVLQRMNEEGSFAVFANEDALKSKVATAIVASAKAASMNKEALLDVIEARLRMRPEKMLELTCHSLVIVLAELRKRESSDPGSLFQD